MALNQNFLDQIDSLKVIQFAVTTAARAASSRIRRSGTSGSCYRKLDHLQGIDLVQEVLVQRHFHLFHSFLLPLFFFSIVLFSGFLFEIQVISGIEVLVPKDSFARSRLIQFKLRRLLNSKNFVHFPLLDPNGFFQDSNPPILLPLTGSEHHPNQRLNILHFLRSTPVLAHFLNLSGFLFLFFLTIRFRRSRRRNQFFSCSFFFTSCSTCLLNPP